MVPQRRAYASVAMRSSGVGFLLLFSSLGLGCGVPAPVVEPAAASSAVAPVKASPLVVPPARSFADLGPAVPVPRSLPQRVLDVVAADDGTLGVVLGELSDGTLSEPILAPRIVDFDRDEVVGVVTGHRHAPRQARFFMGGTRLVTWERDLVVTDMKTGKMIRRLDGFDAVFVSDRGARSPVAVLVTRESSFIDGTTTPGSTTLVDLETGTSRLLAAPSGIDGAVASPTEPIVIVDKDDKLIALHEDGRVLYELDSTDRNKHARSFSADGRLFAVEAPAGFHIHDAATGDFVESVAGAPVWHPTKAEYVLIEDGKVTWGDPIAKRRMSFDMPEPRRVAFEPASGAMVALDSAGGVFMRGSEDKALVKVAAIETRRRSCSLAFEAGLLSRSVCVDTTGGRAGSIILATAEEKLATVADDGTTPGVALVAGAATELVLTCRDRTVRFDGSTTRPVGSGKVGATIFDHDGRTGETLEMSTTSSQAQGTITKLDAKNAPLWSVSFPSMFSSAYVYRSRKLVALTGWGLGSFQIRDTETGALVRTFDFGADTQIYGVYVHPTKDLVFVGFSHPMAKYGEDEATLGVFDLKTAKKVRTLDNARTASFNADGTRFITTNRGTYLWDATSYRKIAELPQSVWPAAAFAFDDTLIAITEYDNHVGHPDLAYQTGIWFVDARTGKMVHDLSTGSLGSEEYVGAGGGRRVYAVDGTDLYGSVNALDLHVWDVATGKKLRTFEGESGSVGLTVLHDGAVLATTGEGRARMLRTADGAKLFLHAVEGVDSCRPVVVDPAGRFEGDADAAATVVHYRLGDDLRRSKMIKPGDAEAEAMRTSGALAAFLQTASSRGTP